MTDFDPKRIYARIVALLKARGESIKHVCQETGIPKPSFFNMKEHIPGIAQAALLSKYLGVTVGWLYGLEEEEVKDYSLTDGEEKFLCEYRKLSTKRKNELNSYCDFLVKQQEEYNLKEKTRKLSK